MADDDQVTDVNKAVAEALDKARKEWEQEEAGLKANRDQLLSEKKALEKKYKGLDGIDPEKYKELVAEAEERERKQAEAKGEWDKLQEKLEANWKKEVEKEKVRADKLHKALEDQLCKRAALEAISKHTKATSLLLPHVLENVRMVESDGVYSAQVFNPSDGSARMAPDAKQATDLMTIDQLVETMKAQEQFSYAFPGAGASGSGGSGGSGNIGAGGAKIVSAEEAAAILSSGDMEKRTALAEGKIKTF